MSHVDWQIFNDSRFYKTNLENRSYIIDYNLVFLHAAKNYIGSGGTQSILRQTIEELEVLVDTDEDNITDGVYLQHFLGVYPFYKNSQLGFIVVDRSDGCFPLVCYPNTDSSESRRVCGLLMCIKGIRGHFDDFIDAVQKINWIDSQSYWENIIENNSL